MRVQLGVGFPLFIMWGHLIGWCAERCEVWPGLRYARENLTGSYRLCVVTDLCVNSHGDVVPREKWPCLRGGAKSSKVLYDCVCVCVLAYVWGACVGAWETSFAGVVWFTLKLILCLSVSSLSSVPLCKGADPRCIAAVNDSSCF